MEEFGLFNKVCSLIILIFSIILIPTGIGATIVLKNGIYLIITFGGLITAVLSFLSVKMSNLLIDDANLMYENIKTIEELQKEIQKNTEAIVALECQIKKLEDQNKLLKENNDAK